MSFLGEKPKITYKVIDEVCGYVMSFKVRGYRRRYVPMNTKLVKVYEYGGEVRIEAPVKIIKEIFNRVENN